MGQNSRSFLFTIICGVAFLFTPSAYAAAPAVSNYSYPFVGSPSAVTTMTGWTSVAGSAVAGGITANVDDAISANVLPNGFTILYNGTTYSNLILSSNSVLCFGICSTSYSGFSGSVPTGPSIQLCAADYNAINIYYLYDASAGTFKIRYEGHQHAKAADGIVADIWEATFHNGSNAFEVGMGISDICSVTNSSPYTPASGFTDGTNYLGYFLTGTSDNLQNRGFQVVTGSLIPGTATLSPASNSATYRSLNLLTVTVNTPGKVTFYQRGKPIPGCKNISTTGSGANIIATCNWRPSSHGIVSLMATLVPTSAGYTGVTSYPVAVTSSSRVTRR